LSILSVPPGTYLSSRAEPAAICGSETQTWIGGDAALTTRNSFHPDPASLSGRAFIPFDEAGLRAVLVSQELRLSAGSMHPELVVTPAPKIEQ